MKKLSFLAVFVLVLGSAVDASPAMPAPLPPPTTSKPPTVQLGQQAGLRVQVAQPGCDPATLPPTASVLAQPQTPARIDHDASDVSVGSDAVRSSVTLSARSICQEELPPLDQGMTNVTTGPRRGYRMLPHMTFDGNLRLTLPFDRALIPPGLTDQDVYTFYFDEIGQRWRPLQRAEVNAPAGKVVSLTNHFTDFINATVNVPDHPETISFDPTSIKDVKAADPSAKVNLIAPPRANNRGEAALSYPLELPAGRMGMTPSLSLTYNSQATNGWLGVGWTLPLPALTIDTRWGVPRYSATEETETYMYNGVQLTPSAHRGAPQARTAEKVFQARVESEFRRTIRHGTGPGNYSWEVTEKSGNTFIFGDTAGTRLTDAAGNIYQWLLREAQDRHGNTVRYTYEGQYPRTIDYSSYTVTFSRINQRPDVIIDARGGFKLVTADLLSKVDVAFQGAAVRRYQLSYQEGAFHKTLLRSVTQFGANGTAFNTHQFTYYDDVRAGEDYQGFAAATEWATGADGVGEVTALSGAVSTGAGGHLYVGFNFNRPTKRGSAGAKVGHSQSASEGVLALVDLNGDRLPDKVFQRDGAIAFRLNTSGPDGSEDFAGSAQGVPTLPAISRERTSMSSFGAEVYLTANGLVNRSTTFTTSSAYFADANGDGLTDLVLGGRVLFNHLNAQGVPEFTADSSQTPVPIGGGTVDTTGIIEDFEAVYQERIDNNPLQDTVRRWTAPFSGRVSVTGGVTLSAGSKDGARVAIQHNGTEVYSAVLNAGEQATPNTNDITVIRGDRLYFRVQSRVDGSGDEVTWDPVVSYLGPVASTDVNNLNVYRYQASEDFVLAGRRGMQVHVPRTGTVRLTGNLRKLGATTDDITVLVLRNGLPAITREMPWHQTGDVVLDEPIDVTEQDVLELRVKVDSPIDARQLAWTPKLSYPDGLDLDSPYDIDLYPVNGLSAPQQAFTVPTSGQVTVAPRLTVSGSGTVTFTAKRRGELVAKRAIQVVDGVVPDVSFPLDVTAGQELFFDFSVYDPQLAVINAATEVDGVEKPSAVHSAGFPGMLPQPYRGWAYAGYNGNRDRADRAITEADFNETFTEGSTYDPRTAKVHLFTPFPREASWRGADEQSFVKAGSMSSSRLGLDDITVPRAADFAGGRAVDRLGAGTQTAVGGGASFLSGSVSVGSTSARTDYLDLNGDGFPDIVSNGRVQYSTMGGGLEPNSRTVNGLGSHVRDGDATAANVGVGGSPASFTINGRGEVDASGKAAPRNNTTGAQMVALGLSATLGFGDSTPEHELLDLNGDGLPDRVSQQGSQLMVALNLGYSFAPAEPWGDGVLNDGSSESLTIGGSIGYNAGIYDFAGGLSLSKNNSETSATLADVNGDGLLDRVLFGGGVLRVGFNTGQGFANLITWGAATEVASGNTTLGGGLYFTVGIGPLCWPTPKCFIIINPGADAQRSVNREEAGLRDVDGDGYADHLTSSGDSAMTVARNRTGRTNLLKSVSRPLGASFELEYKRDGNTVAQPQSRWVLSKVSLNDGHPGDGVDTNVTTMSYESGNFDRFEREFLGYAKVTERQHNTDGTAYRGTVTEYHNDSILTRGLLTHLSTQDGAGRPFRETRHAYQVRDLGNGSGFPQLVTTDQYLHEGAPSAAKSTSTTYQYDTFGNVSRYAELGEPGAADDTVAEIGYAACPQTHIVGKANRIVVTGGGNRMRHRESDVDCDTGDVTQVREFVDSSSAAVTGLVYFPDGNLASVTGPPNATGQRYRLAYEYDAITRSYVVKTTDSHNLVSTNGFDLRFGQPVITTDINGNATTYAYDEFGRNTAVTGPYDSAATIRFEYHPEAVVPWALTRHLDSFRNAADPIDTVLFVDGLGRTLQTKKDVTVHGGPDAATRDVMSISGRITFDAFGRGVQMRYPTTEPLGTPGAFNPTPDPVVPTRIDFDVLDRVTRTTLPDGTATTVAFGFGPDRDGFVQSQITTTDALGRATRTFRDARNLTTSVQQPGPIWTSYAYDPLGQIVEFRDDRGNVGRAGYDLLGRRSMQETPDGGRIEAVYDLASNLTAKITPNLRAGGKRISYRYDFDRLVSISYPDFPANNVTYTYGGPGAADNRAGRVTRVVDESGVEDRFYGKLGEVVREIRVINSDTGAGPNTYTTSYVYDTFGRIQSLTYPDGELLTYRYDSGGSVRQASGRKGEHSYAYVNRYEYDKFEQAVFTEAGNGVRTNYRYDAANRRLVNISAGAFQNLNYGYDNVGNLLTLTNDVPVAHPSSMGGPIRQTFGYDDLDRLTSSTGSYISHPSKTDRYQFTLSYDTIHNVVSKRQSHDIDGISQHRTTYNLGYTYGGPRPHAATNITGHTYTYDANGNQTGFTDDNSGQRRTVVWDEENRIQSVFDNGHEMTYRYNDAGERVIKRGPQGETAYVNQFFTMRNRQVGTKHILIGGKRLVSKLMKQENLPREKDLYFFHSDSLGSNNFVTAADGKIYQHTEFFPGGQSWVDESSNIQRTPYLHSGKEFDEDTQLYYYGARYYDARTGAWQSPDPQSASYLDGEPNGGVYASVNLASYTHSANNPLRYSDPDGRWVHVAIGAGVGAVFSAGVEGYRQYQTGQFNGWRLAGAAGGGAVSGAIGAATFGAGTALAAGSGLAVRGTVAVVSHSTTGAVSGAAGGATEALVNGENVRDRALEGAAWGAVGNVGSAAVGSVGSRVYTYFRPQSGAAAATTESAAARGLRLPCNSFKPGTLVAMADGTVKAIEDIDIGDRVLSTDPRNGHAVPREVVELITGQGNKTLTDVTVRTREGDRVITATADHAFWVPGSGWVDASKLRAGMRLLTHEGRPFEVSRIVTYNKPARVHNFTVADLHTFYVLAGKTPVLVHNEDPCAPHVAMGLTSIRNPNLRVTNHLNDFAAQQGAITWQDKMFAAIFRRPLPTNEADFINQIVASNGKISFSLKGINNIDDIVAGRFNPMNRTASELHYICGNAAARAITTFYDGNPPC